MLTFKIFIDSLDNKFSTFLVCQDFPSKKIFCRDKPISVCDSFSNISHESKICLITDFFRDKFDVKSVDITDLDNYMHGMPVISAEESEMLATEISSVEVAAWISKLENDKAPGLDGLTHEFYKKYKEQFSIILKNVALFSMRNGSFPLCMRTAISSLIHKKGSADDLKNFRTISLTNSDYKIISNVLKSRLLPILPSLVGPWQTCGIKGRSIYDNLTFLRDAFQSNELVGALFSLDHEAAFDRVSFEYLFKILEKYGLPQSFIDYIKILHTDFSLSVVIGNTFTKKVPLKVGLKQGDPVASVLYVLAIEPFLFKVSRSLSLSGPSAWPRAPNKYLSAYADDTTALVSSQEQLKIILFEYHNFSKLSASKLNKFKSELLFLGGVNWLESHLPTKKDGLKILGIFFGDSGFMAQNFTSLLEKFCKKLAFYSSKSCAVSFFSRARILNTYLLPVWWYVFKVLDPPESFIAKITELAENFLWKGSKRWVGRHLLYLPLANGGIGVRHPLIQLTTFRVVFANKIINNSESYFCNFAHTNISSILIRNEPVHDTPFYDNVYKSVQILGLSFDLITRKIFHAVTLNNVIFFRNNTFPGLIQLGCNTIGEFESFNFSQSMPRFPSPRLICRERAKLRDILDTYIPSQDCVTLRCLKYSNSSDWETVVKHNRYLLCSRIAQKIQWSKVSIDTITDPSWIMLQKTEVSNPEKDIVYKLLHNTGLTPKIAESMGLHEGRDCPFCHFTNIESRHYFECFHFQPNGILFPKFLTGT